jgi:hypothetical protein
MKDLSSAKQCKLQLLYVGYWDKKICLQQSSASHKPLKLANVQNYSCTGLVQLFRRVMTFGNKTSGMKIKIGSPQPKVTLMS